MKIGYVHFYDEHEGLFDDSLKLVGYWHSNDGNWRDEYFGPGLRKLGLDIKRVPSTLWKKAERELKKALKKK